MYGRCKLGNDCSYVHMKLEKEDLKSLEKEVLELKKQICVLQSAMETGFISLHKEIEISKNE